MRGIDRSGCGYGLWVSSASNICATTRAGRGVVLKVLLTLWLAEVSSQKRVFDRKDVLKALEVNIQSQQVEADKHEQQQVKR
mmetsp:Transcript_151567/g.264801  ORF Transcript_151567/g.264801 Transcript_151567/m.264801 type:complete len:82 (-) Transcript_151567:685-930(-)